MSLASDRRQTEARADSRRWEKMPKMEAMAGANGQFLNEYAVWARVIGTIRSLGRQGPRSTAYVPISGSWGNRKTKPSLVSVVGIDPDNGDNYPSAGDTLTLKFDRKTNKAALARPQPPPPGSKAYVDFFFSFDPSLGESYRCSPTYSSLPPPYTHRWQLPSPTCTPSAITTPSTMTTPCTHTPLAAALQPTPPYTHRLQRSLHGRLDLRDQDLRRWQPGVGGGLAAVRGRGRHR